jgi:hypothetical protein
MRPIKMPFWGLLGMRGEGIAGALIGMAIMALVLMAVMSQSALFTKQGQTSWVKRELDSLAQQKASEVQYQLNQAGGLRSVLRLFLSAGQNLYDPIMTLNPAVSADFLTVFLQPQVQATTLDGVIGIEIRFTAKLFNVTAGAATPIVIGTDPISAIRYVDLKVDINKITHPELGPAAGHAHIVIQN